MRSALRIGEVATEAEVSVQTLRFYERRGIVKPSQRASSGYREYVPEDVKRVRFVKRAQELGFTLREITELLALRVGDGRTCAQVRAAAMEKLEDVERRLSRLTAMRRELRALVKSCKPGSAPRCAILEALDDPLPSRGRSGGPRR